MLVDMTGIVGLTPARENAKRRAIEAAPVRDHDPAVAMAYRDFARKLTALGCSELVRRGDDSCGFRCHRLDPHNVNWINRREPFWQVAVSLAVLTGQAQDKFRSTDDQKVGVTDVELRSVREKQPDGLEGSSSK